MLRRRQQQVQVVTQARPSRYDDIARRERRYLIRMAIRTVAVLVAFLAPLPLWGRLIAVMLGLVLPWISVTAANIGPLPDKTTAPTSPSRELPPSSDEERRAG